MSSGETSWVKMCGIHTVHSASLQAYIDVNCNKIIDLRIWNELLLKLFSKKKVMQIYVLYIYILNKDIVSVFYT